MLMLLLEFTIYRYKHNAANYVHVIQMFLICIFQRLRSISSRFWWHRFCIYICQLLSLQNYFDVTKPVYVIGSSKLIRFKNRVKIKIM